MAPAEPYNEVLRDAITSGGSSRRKLSFLLAERTGNQQSSEYRALGKYLSGEETPSRDRAAALAVLLNDPRVALVPDASSRRLERLAQLEAGQNEIAAGGVALVQALEMLLEQVVALGGSVPQETVQALGRAAVHMRNGSPPA